MRFLVAGIVFLSLSGCAVTTPDPFTKHSLPEDCEKSRAWSFFDEGQYHDAIDCGEFIYIYGEDGSSYKIREDALPYLE